MVCGEFLFQKEDRYSFCIPGGMIYSQNLLIRKWLNIDNILFFQKKGSLKKNELSLKELTFCFEQMVVQKWSKKTLTEYFKSLAKEDDGTSPVWNADVAWNCFSEKQKEESLKSFFKGV